MPGAQHTSCTIEMTNTQKRVDVAVVDEVQVSHKIFNTHSVQSRIGDESCAEHTQHHIILTGHLFQTSSR